MSPFILPLLFVASIVAGLALYAHRRQPDAHAAARSMAAGQLRSLAPRIPFALLAAECLGRLLPREQVGAFLGDQSGVAGTLLAAAVGAFLPGGPLVAFPLAVALFRAGAAEAPMVALLTAWALLAVNRTLLLELPMLGSRFTLGRLAVSTPLPLIAGLLAGFIADLFVLPGPVTP